MSMIVCRHRDQIPSGWFLGDCAVSGGTLEEYLRDAMVYSGGKLCIQLRSRACIYPLPCPSGAGRIPSPEEIQSLKSLHKSHFSEALMTNLLTYETQDGLFCLLFDTDDSLRKKAELLKALKIPMVLTENQRLFHLLQR